MDCSINYTPNLLCSVAEKCISIWDIKEKSATVMYLVSKLFLYVCSKSDLLFTNAIFCLIKLKHNRLNQICIVHLMKEHKLINKLAYKLYMYASHSRLSGLEYIQKTPPCNSHRSYNALHLLNRAGK